MALVLRALTYYFLSDSEDGYKVSSYCYSVFSHKISDPFLKAPSSLYTTFLHLHHTRAGQICRCCLCYINLPPKLLDSSCGSEKSLLKHHFHINAAIVLVVEHLMWRQQLFLELLYRHAPVCSFAVLIFEVLWKIVFDSKSLFFHLSLG